MKIIVGTEWEFLKMLDRFLQFFSYFRIYWGVMQVMGFACQV